MIRKATDADVHTIVAMWSEFMEEHDRIIIDENPELVSLESKESTKEKSYETFIRAYADADDGILYVEEIAGEIVGYIFIYIKEEIPIYTIKKVGVVSDLYVKADHRNKGISSRLKEKAMGWFRQKGLTSVSVPMYPANKRAYEIYKKWGFFDYKVELRKKI